MAIKIEIEVPESIVKKVAGSETTVDVTKCDAACVAHVFEYGLRILGDRVNSIVNTAKKADDRADMTDAEIEAEIESTVAKLYDGSIWITTRGNGGVDAVTREMRRLAKAAWIATLPKDKRKAARNVADGELAVHMDAIIAADPEGYRTRAKTAIAKREAEAKARAEAIAAAMNTVAQAEIDLDALLKKS